MIDDDNIKLIPGFPLYAVSKEGDIYSSYKGSWKKLNPHTNKKGYRRVLLIDLERNKKGLGVHSCVLLAFVGPRPVGMECCHNDGNPENNKLSNLRWDTPKANCHDKKIHGTLLVGDKVHFVKLDKGDIIPIFEMRAEGFSYKEIAQEFNVSFSSILAIIKRENWNHINIPQDLIDAAWKNKKTCMFKTGQKINQADVYDILNLYNQGETKRSLCQKYNISACLLRMILNKRAWIEVQEKNDIPRERRIERSSLCVKLTDEQVKLVFEMRFNHASILEIAREMKVSIHAIRLILKRDDCQKLFGEANFDLLKNIPPPRRGEGPKMKLNEDSILKIFQMRKDGLKITEIAEKMGVKKLTISKIINRRAWIHVKIPEDLLPQKE